ncbi:MFS transporter [Nocardioides marmorisolisilvae]|uniref:MFS transporter n=2 Tax=Nocardioides marmorisolisilvae TaxID=1542737 RepID=A0A3N0DQ99_9ACTN|nr:MFS transporter [Nocardioides marmorisolisilvae]
MLAVSTTAQGAAAVTIHGPAFLIPALHEQRGLSLPTAALVAGASMFGVMSTLVAWGWIVDRFGERFALLAGLGATFVAGLISTQVHSTWVLGVVLFFGGAAAASTGSASGRVVVGWFPPRQRGLAMGIRQTAQPIGVGVAAITIAVIADRHGIDTALWVPTLAAAIAAVLVFIVILDPPRPERSAGTAPNPYREDSFLTRIHGVSVLLVVPQFMVWTFALVWLIDDRGWSPGAAGTMVALAQVFGAGSRILVGAISDRVGSRTRVLRWVTVAAALTMAALGLTAGRHWSIAVALMLLATAVTVADNGLSFTAVAERAGPFWSGRALGVQNTAQYLTAAITGPVAGVVIDQWGHPTAFALCAVFPLLALGFVPKDERPFETVAARPPQGKDLS